MPPGCLLEVAAPIRKSSDEVSVVGDTSSEAASKKNKFLLMLLVSILLHVLNFNNNTLRIIKLAYSSSPQK